MMEFWMEYISIENMYINFGIQDIINFNSNNNIIYNELNFEIEIKNKMGYKKE